jgi:hypothetical protein
MAGAVPSNQDLVEVVNNGISDQQDVSKVNGVVAEDNEKHASLAHELGVSYQFPKEVGSADVYRVLDQYHSKPNKFRVACAGAGASGLCLAYKIQRMLVPGSWELSIYEKNADVGGTWLENTYPGVACDIPSHVYSFTFDPKPDWSHYFAYGSEIEKYFQGFADRHHCRDFIQFNSKITKAAWDQPKAVWNLTITDVVTGQERRDWAHVFVNGTGIRLSKITLP